MNKILSVLIFPFFWVVAYLYRIIWFDFIEALIQAFLQLGLAIVSIFRSGKLFFIQFAGFLWLLITLPFTLIIDIPVGLVVTFVHSMKFCKNIFSGEIDAWDEIKEAFKPKRNKRYQRYFND